MGIRERKLALQERRGAVGCDQPGVNTVTAEAKIVCGADWGTGLRHKVAPIAVESLTTSH
jgi:hypothetical protein